MARAKWMSFGTRRLLTRWRICSASVAVFPLREKSPLTDFVLRSRPPFVSATHSLPPLQSPPPPPAPCLRPRLLLRILIIVIIIIVLLKAPSIQRTRNACKGLQILRQCVSVCVCVRACVCACVRARACVRSCLRMCACMHVLACACVSASVCVCVRACVYVHACWYVRGCVCGLCVWWGGGVGGGGRVDCLYNNC